MKNTLRILASLLSLCFIFNLYINIHNPSPGFENYVPVMSAIMALVFAGYAISGKSGIDNFYVNKTLDKNLPPSFHPTLKGWIFLGLVILILCFLGYYFLLIRA